MRDFIREQIEFRIKFMDRLCWSQGSCKLCGCQTTHLQMANKACDKPCYPRMMSAKQWKLFKVGSYLYLDGNKLWEYFPEPDPHLTTLGKGFEEELVFYMRPEKYKRTFFTHTQKPINHVEP